MAAEEPARTTAETTTGRRSLLITLVLAIVLAAVYLLSAFAYGNGLDRVFVPPTPPPGGVAIALVPVKIDADSQTSATQVLMFPDGGLLDGQGRLTRTIQVDVYPAVADATLFFQEGTVPSPQKVEVPALGFVQRYPFDQYTYSLDVTGLILDDAANGGRTTRLPVELDLFFNVPGWRFSGSTTNAERSAATATGEIGRSAPIVAIAVIFVSLILMFGCLAVITVVSGVRGRTDLGIAQAAWLTSATFALIALRNAFPGDPPLGSWIDILVYFWTITTIMLMIGLAVITTQLRRNQR